MTLCFNKINVKTGCSSLIKLALLLLTGLIEMANVQAADPYNNSYQVSMITQPAVRDTIRKEIKVLEEEYIDYVVQALNREYSGPDYSRDEIYDDYLVQAIEGKTQQDQPDFADDDVYVNYLVSVVVGK